MTVAEFPLTGGHRFTRQRIQGVFPETAVAGRHAAEDAWWGQRVITAADNSVDTDVASRAGLGTARSTADTAVSTSDTLARAGGYPRSLTDQAKLDTGTAPAIVLAALRNMSDSCTSDDSSVGALLFMRTAADTSAAADSVGRAMTAPRSTADNAKLDTGTAPSTRLTAATRTGSDTATTDETLSAGRSQSRIAVNSTLVGGIGTRATGGHRFTRRNVQATAPANDAFWGHLVQTPDGASALDSGVGLLGHSQAFTRNPTDTATAADVATKTYGTTRTTANPVTVSSGLFTSIPGSGVQGGAKLWLGSPGLSSTINQPDAAAAVDTAAGSAGRGRNVTDTSADTDSVARTGSTRRALADTAVETDAPSRGNLQNSRTPADSAVDTETLSRTLSALRATADTSTGLDAASRPHNASAAVTDNATATDATARGALNSSRTGADSAVDTDSATRSALAFTRSSTDNAVAADVVARILNALTRTGLDSATASEVGSAVRTIIRTATDQATDADSATHGIRFFSGTATDNATGVDTPARLVMVARNTPDASAALDTIAALVQIGRLAADEADTTDAAAPGGLITMRGATDMAILTDDLVLLMSRPPTGLTGLVHPSSLAGLVSPTETVGVS